MLIALGWCAMRFVGLEQVPYGLTTDETLSGLHVVCLAQTGASADGQRWPLFATGFAGGLYTPTYLYTLTPGRACSARPSPPSAVCLRQPRSRPSSVLWLLGRSDRRPPDRAAGGGGGGAVPLVAPGVAVRGRRADGRRVPRLGRVSVPPLPACRLGAGERRRHGPGRLYLSAGPTPGGARDAAAARGGEEAAASRPTGGVLRRDGGPVHPLAGRRCSTPTSWAARRRSRS